MTSWSARLLAVASFAAMICASLGDFESLLSGEILRPDIKSQSLSSSLQRNVAASGPGKVPNDIIVPRQECVARKTDRPVTFTDLKPRLGIVFVHCDENMSMLHSIPCHPDDPTVVFHVYNKCGMDLEKLKADLGPALPCVRTLRVVPITIETELAWTKHHREYLEHIILRYDQLEPLTMFVKANLSRRRLVLSEMVNDALENAWAFKSYGGPKARVDLDAFPEGGNGNVWRSEICILYQRYLCVDVCAEPQLLAWHGISPPLYNTRSMWVASAERLRSLPVTEYQWWREYISNTPVQEGITRRYMLERLWQAMLGCPEEHSDTEIMGCKSTQSNPAGDAIAPPALLSSRTNAPPFHPLVHWLQPPATEFHPDQAYPNFNNLLTFEDSYPWLGKSAENLRITFVFALPSNDLPAPNVLRSTAVAAVRFHANARFVIVLEEGRSYPEEVLMSPFWNGRAEFKKFSQAGRFPFVWFVEPLGRMELELLFLETIEDDWVTMDSMHMYGESCWAAVERAHSDSRAGASRFYRKGRYATVGRNRGVVMPIYASLYTSIIGMCVHWYGYLVMADVASLPVKPLWSAFDVGSMHSHEQYDSESWALPMRAPNTFNVSISAVYSLQPLAPIVFGTWFVHWGHAASAVRLLHIALKLSSNMSGQKKDRQLAGMNSLTACCLASNLIAEQRHSKLKPFMAKCHLAKCGEARGDGPISMLFLPCDMWQASLGGRFAEVCPVRGASTRMIEFPPWEANSHAKAVLTLKDKSSGMATLKTAVRQLLKSHGLVMKPELSNHYLDVLNTTEMKNVWMPPEKRGPPTLGRPKAPAVEHGTTMAGLRSLLLGDI